MSKKKKSSNSKMASPKTQPKTYGAPRRSRNYEQFLPKQPAPAAPKHLSLQEEARLTGSKSSFWNIDANLRSRRVAFVSAGAHRTMEDDNENDDSQKQDTQSDLHRDLQEVGLQAGAKPTNPTSPSKTEPIAMNVQDSTAITSLDSENVAAAPPKNVAEVESTSLDVPSESLFCIDVVGDRQNVPQIGRLHIRSPSPESADSEEEVLFTGRANHVQVVDDPLHTSEAPRNTELIPTKTASKPASKPTWDDTNVEWVSRSTPGKGWSIPRAQPKRAESGALLNAEVKEKIPPQVDHDSENDVAPDDDYIQNVREFLSESQGLATFANRELDGELQHSDADQASDVMFDRRDDDDDDDDGDDDDEDDDDSVGDFIDNMLAFSGSDKSLLSEQSDGSESFGEIGDEQLAILLAKQEELGLGSDDLMLFDHNIDTTVSKAAKRYAKETPKKARRSAGHFPSASALADLLDQQPKMAWEIMGMDPPSLRSRKGKGRAVVPDFELSDEELNASMQTAWEKDRERKRERKFEREQLRAQGLLGLKNGATLDNIHKYGEGMTIMQIASEFEVFLASSKQEHALPPMDKRRRKMVHEIASTFKLNTKSTGSGHTRHTKLIKTSRTTEYVESRFVTKARKLNMGFFPRSDLPPSKELKSRKRIRMGGIGGAVKFSDGDIVGASAPVLGSENRGRAMLEKMGWSTGMALGHVNNKGILEPVAHVVKNSKAGLG